MQFYPVTTWAWYAIKGIIVAFTFSSIWVALDGDTITAVILGLLWTIGALFAKPMRDLCRVKTLARRNNIGNEDAHRVDHLTTRFDQIAVESGIGEAETVRRSHLRNAIPIIGNTFPATREVYEGTPKLISHEVFPSGVDLMVKPGKWGQDSQDLADPLMCQHIEQTIQDAWNNDEVTVTGSVQGAKARLQVRWTGDPLAEGLVLDAFPDFDPATGTVEYGRDSEDRPAKFKMSGIAGCSIAGLPGAGKSALATVTVGPMLLSPAANVAVIDGKGGTEWAWAKPLADFYTNEDRDLETVAEALEARVELMRQRLKTQKVQRGTSNFWGLGATAEYPVYVTVIDEVQSYVGSGVAGSDKEKKEQVRRITEAIIDLLKKGRSVGMFTIVMTQKPTSDALPTAVRDVADLRIALRVRTQESVKAALGETPDDPALSPLHFDKDTPGLALIDTGGEFRKVRAHFIPESVAERIIQEATDA